ncbi:uncharacterized protein LOC105214929 [Zeugodacus cucurbitae]|uniref:uncharacterized protein LOC105214929 n=1 Tax=Zeugodacus cucurbitae TaxID=28588 RepID=UPI0023D8E68E|nr:uncharacterized protein LOC105214929 [Zeugodacus cucurbitae]
MPKIRKCRVRDCESTSGVLRLFRFPNERELAAKWKENLQILPTDHFSASNTFICEKHFAKEAIGQRMLRKNAIPTLCLGIEGSPAQQYVAAKLYRSCCVSNCTGWESRKLFEFPKTEVAANNWARACNLQLPLQKNKRLFVCERHFYKKDVSAKRVLHEVVPALNIKENDDNSDISSEWVLPAVVKSYNIKNEKAASPSSFTFSEMEKMTKLCEIDMKCESSEEITTFDHEHYARVARGYQKNALKQSQTIAQLKKQIYDLQKKCEALEKSIIIPSGASEYAITFARMILKNKTSYDEKEKIMALNINYMSTKAYNFMRDDLSFALPHKKTLLRWRPIRSVSPGIDEKVLNNLEKIVRNMKREERICQIIFDEVSIKKDLTYNKVRDVIDGFVDNGEGHRESVIGNKCCFFMVKGLVSKWKYIVSYYVAKEGVKSVQLEKLLKNNIDACENIGLNIKSVVCDQGGQNMKLKGLLGATSDQPYFFYKEKKIYFMFDYCHLIKCIRNMFLKYDLETSDGIATSAVVKQIYAIDQANVNFKMCPKLTYSHVYPGCFEKMSVSRATQLLSNSVAAAIEMATNQNLLGSDEQSKARAKATQSFVKKMNDLFDELDCKTLHNANPIRRPIQRDCIEKINRLKKYIAYIAAIKSPHINIMCLDSTKLTITAMIGISEDIFKENDTISFILLGKMNQDALENFFYKIRANLGINSHPSAHEIQYIVARLISMHVLRRQFSHTGSNCEEDDDINLDWNYGQEDDLKENLQPAEQLAVEQIEIPDEHFASAEKPAETQVRRYYTGYAIYQKVLCRLKCQKCVAVMKNTTGSLEDSSEALIRSKNYKSPDDLRLVNPDDRVFEVCRLQFNYYKELFAKHAAKVGIKSLMIAQITKKTQEIYPQWYEEAGECLGHRHTFLDFLITVLLYKNSKWLALQTAEQCKKVAKASAYQKKLKKLTT